jgi:hypothetical protein
MVERVENGWWKLKTSGGSWKQVVEVGNKLWRLKTGIRGQ